MSMAVGWFFCLLSVVLLLLAGMSQLIDTTSLSSDINASLKAARDVHEVFLVLIASSYDLYIKFIKEITIISLTCELFPILASSIQLFLPDWLFEGFATLTAPLVRFGEPTMPELEHINYYQQCSQCLNNKEESCECCNDSSNKMINSSSSSGSSNYGSKRNQSISDPDDLLVFDSTFGIVPSGVLKLWK